MGNIRLLAEHEIRQIAAGEVVERPASVVKELIENGIDAHAKTITITIRDGGRSSITVTDDGCGMSPEDVHLSIQHHATSKFTSIDSLSALATFGFRGEALSTIGAVSRMSILTRRVDDSVGFMLTLDAGTVVAQGPSAAPFGTTVTVEALFAYLPARRKFLKQRDTEWRAIYQLIVAYAALYPSIRWHVQHDGVSVLVAPECSTMRERISVLVEQDVERSLRTVAYERNGISVTGVITDHHYQRYDRRALFFFVNRRWVKNNQLGKAVMSGYAGVLQPQRYPYACLSITVPPEQVDINIHPRKEEVLFLRPYLVTAAIEEAVYAALKDAITPIGGMIVQGFDGAETSVRSVTTDTYMPSDYSIHRSAHTPVLHNDEQLLLSALQRPDQVRSWMVSPVRPAEQLWAERPLAEKFPAVQTVQRYVQQREYSPIETLLPDAVSIPQYTYIGQLGALYLLVETHDGLSILDQHAAHESILYAQIQNNRHSSVMVAMAIAQEAVYTAEEYSFLEQMRASLYGVGIALEFYPPDMIAIVGTAPYCRSIDLVSFLKELVRDSAESYGVTEADISDLQRRMNHTIAARIACKSAIKAGDIVSPLEAEQLLEKFWQTESRLTCPHGRPTVWRMTYRELERFFKRVI